MNIALILSGGTGSRLQAQIRQEAGTSARGFAAPVPKQYMEVNGKAVIFYCLKTLLCHAQIDAVQIVADGAWHDFILEGIRELESAGKNRAARPKEERGAECAGRKFRGFSRPGKNRQLSVLQGLEDIRKYAGDTDYVLIHDAARPLLSGKLISDCLEAACGHDGALPVLPMKDTVYFSENGRTVASLLDRQRIFAGQAPEAFRLGIYYEANRLLLPDRILSINGSTEPAVMAGMDVVMIPGDENNFKITTKADLEKFERLMFSREENG